jgi:hypothetical protein
VNIPTVLAHRERFSFKEKSLNKERIIPILKTKVGGFFGNPDLFTSGAFGGEFQDLNHYNPGTHSSLLTFIEHDDNLIDDNKSNAAGDIVVERGSQRSLSFVIHTPKGLPKPEGGAQQPIDGTLDLNMTHGVGNDRAESFDDLVKTIRTKDEKMSNILNLIRLDDKY